MRTTRGKYRKKTSHTKPICYIVGLLLLVLGILAAHSQKQTSSFSSARNSIVPTRPAEQQEITILHAGESVTIGLEDYLIGVTAAEMPAHYALEALKAQAVAARTYTLRKKACGGCSKGADICTDSGHCQAYADDDTLRERWGADYAENLEKIEQAVYGTAGEIVTYHGEAIDAMYHASSGGATENSEDVYKNAIPYLRGVESPDAAGYEKTVSYSRAEFAARINKKLDTALDAQALENELEILSRYPSGRVAQIRIGEKTVSGSRFRGAAGLPSALFSYELTEDEICFSVTGYGHGVGMSQSGANYYAQACGWDYREILLHYYTDVVIEQAAG